MENETFISCVAWIHRGFAAKVPLEAEIPAEEIEQMKQDPELVEELRKEKRQRELEMEDEQQPVPMFSQGMADPDGAYPDMVDDLEDDEKEDYYIKDTDALIVAGKVEQEYSSLEVYVYEQENNNLFVHHEIMLSSFPLAIEWLNVDLGSLNSNSPAKGNYAIVSSFLPEIEIWNLDMAEAVEPELILGGEIVSTKKKVKKFTNKAKKYKEGSHTDSVLSLSLNPSHRNILASGSADSTVKIWDIKEGKNVHTCTHHQARVNKICWSPTDPTVIFTAGEDKQIAVIDSRYPNDLLVHKLPQIESTVESACWNINQPTQICYSTDKGNLNIVDVRAMDKLVTSFAAHQGHSITDVKVGAKNLIYTCSEDESVRVWNLNNLEAPVGYKKPKCGKMYCLDVMESDEGPIVTCGNGKGELFVWDITESEQISNYWKTN